MDIVLHFWGSRKHKPSENASMVFIEVDDADALNAEFCTSIKQASGKIPRTGIPRISKVRELKDDKRFTICDPAGNTLYIGTPSGGEEVESRTLESEQHAKTFAAIYDLLHSRESPEKAAKAMQAFLRLKGELSEVDKLKLAALDSQIKEAQVQANHE